MHRQPLAVDFKGLVRLVRVRRDWTQMQLALALGVTVRTIGRWERGDTEPPEPGRSVWASRLEALANE